MPKKPSKNGHTPKPGDRPPTAYFLSLEVENVRCFGEKQKLDLFRSKGKPAPWTIILGVNGTGKTTLLQSLAYLEWKHEKPNPEYHVQEGYASRFLLRPTIDDNGFFRSQDEGKGFRWSAQFIVTTGLLDPADYQLDQNLKCSNYMTSGTKYRFVDLDPLFRPALFVAYGAGRRIGELSFLESSSDDDPTGTLFSDKAKLRNPEEWLLFLDYTSTTEYSSDTNRDLQRFRRHIAIDLLKQVLWEIDDIRFVPGEGFHPKPRVEMKTPYGWVPFRQLGYGYQSLATWVADFASRMVERYPESKNPLAEPAVVLVDEIDLHLHPKWQRELMDRLTKLFPNTQFIATAHSPLVVQAAANANLAVLRRVGDHVEIDNDVDYIRNWRVDQILTSDLFGLDSARPPHIAEWIAERDKILSKPKLTKADEKKIADLEAKIGELPYGETKQQRQMLNDIQESLDLLKRERLAKK